MIARSRWIGAALVAGMVVSGYVLAGYLIARALLWLLDQASRAGW